MKYAVNYDVAADGVTVTFPDIPEAITGAETLEEAKKLAQDALLTALEFYFEDSRTVPAPAAEADEYVELPLSTEAKVLLLNELLEKHVTHAELARRIHVKPQEISRLVNLRHNTKIDRIALALQALGRHLKIELA